MEFKKYQHLERFGTSEVEGIEFGKCYVYYKIDGTNASVWMDEEGNIRAGSRKRSLTLDNDNAGFYNHIVENESINNYLTKYPNHRLYGEWLVPHSLKTYREDAWRRFYVFDVCLDIEEDVEYLTYESYKPLLEEFAIDYIPPIAIIKNPTYENLIHLIDKTGQFLIKDGEGNGEGIVIKNYDFYNKYKRQTWAKIVCNEFKEKHNKVMGAPMINSNVMIEEKIVKEFCTDAFIEKEYAKIVNEKDGWTSKYIPMLFGKVFHELVKEESYNMVKKFKNPTINYKTLNALVIQKIKENNPNLFM